MTPRRILLIQGHPIRSRRTCAMVGTFSPAESRRWLAKLHRLGASDP